MLENTRQLCKLGALHIYFLTKQSAVGMTRIVYQELNQLFCSKPKLLR